MQTGRHLLTGFKEVTTRTRAYLDQTLDHRHAGSAQAVGYDEDGALDGDLAVIGGDVQTPAVLVGGVNEHVAPGQRDRGSATRCPQFQLRARCDLEDGTVIEGEEGARFPRRAEDLTGADLVAGDQVCRLTVVEPLQPTVHRRDRRVQLRARHGVHGQVPACDGQPHDQDRGDGPQQGPGRRPVTGFDSRCWRPVNLSAFGQQRAATRQAFARVVLDQQCAPFVEATCD